MTATDIAVIAAVLGIGAAPGLLARLQAVRLLGGEAAPAQPEAPAEASKEAWRQEWTSTLISLLADLEKQDMAPATKLCRELMWEIIGGEPDPAGKK
jgi:hypothetical protein